MRVPTLTTLYLALEVLPEQSGKKTKNIRIEKEVKLSLFAVDMILHIENPKDYQKTDLINKFRKVSRYLFCINMQKSVVFYTEKK